MKIAILVLTSVILSASLSASCQKKDINELKYMSKNELTLEYKSENISYNFSNKSAEKYTKKAEEYKSSGNLSMAQMNNSIATTQITDAGCHLKNRTLIGRVLTKDFGMTPQELSKMEQH